MSEESANRSGVDLAEMDELREEVDSAERRAVRTVEFGNRAMVIAGAVFVLLIGIVLPWMDGQTGWQVLLNGEEAIPRLFAGTAIGIGVLGSIATLITRRWALCWVCAIGGWFASVDGLLAIWSQQSMVGRDVAATGPEFGMIISAVAMVVLAVQWFRMAWSRP
ncbi:hypothetical protein [Tamaricihabitans halophyticus]|nr:hypothetical protein [Tamaricihabitans halophyticus]